MNREKKIVGIRKTTGNFLNKLDNQYEKNLDNSFYQGYDLCMMKTMNLLIDSNLKDDKVICLLQKHFDLKLSEAENMIRTAKNRKNRNQDK